MTGMRFAVLAGVLAIAGAVRSENEIWPKSLQEECPKTYEAFGVTNGIRTLFYENVPYRGRETRVFAYLGVPKAADGKPVPGMVLVHGGGGSAYHRWVKYWNDRGYAAIAMDWNGCVSRDVKGQRSHERHPWAGPEGCHSWNDIDAPVGDQWPYHAVAAIIRAHTLLATTPGVDAGRIGLTGISWGGYLSCIASGVDPRFRFVAPVYGCGFISEHSMWRDDGYTDGRFPTCDPKKIERYNALWDPKNFLGKAKMPFFFIDSANDHAYPLDILEKSRALVTSPVTRLTIPKYPHCHGEASERPREIFDYADGLFGRGPRLPRCTSMGVRNWAGDIVAKFDLGDEEIASASFCCTYGHGDCREREWEELPATFSNDTVKVSWPADNYTGFFFSIVTKRGNRVTSDAVLAPGLVPGLVKHLAIDPTKENLRNGEGDTVMLKDGRMLFAYSHFTNHSSTNNHQSGGTDGYSASIYGWISPDGGRTWPGEPRELIPNDAGLNLMCVSFLRLRDGSLAMFYLKKNGDDDCRPVMRVSKDEGETWGEARYCIDEAHRQYYVMNNARVIRLKSGRILLPLCLHRYTAGTKKGGFGSSNEPNGEVLSAWSDDDGATWRISDSVKAVLEGKQRAAQEPGVVELRDGRVLMYIRSGGQRQRLLYSYSSDGGESWSAPEPGPVSSPTAPATMARLSSGELVMVYNCHDGANKALWEYRTPLVIAVSEDEGRTWTRQRSIADSLTDHGNCYASVREYDGRLYVSYYAHYVLRHLRLKSFPVSSVLAWPKKDDGAAEWRAAAPVWPAGESETLNSHFAFEAPFAYAAGRPKPTLRVTAAYTYRITLNGRFVGYGPVRAPKDVYRVDTWTLDAAPGENCLVIEAAGYRCNNYCFIDQEPFLQAEVLDGARVLAATGARGGFTARRTGRIARVPRFSAQRTFVEAWRVGGERGPELPLRAQKAKRCEERPIAVPDFRIDDSYRPIRRERLVPAPAKEIVRNGFIEPRPGGRQHVRYPVDTLETNPYYDLQRYDYAADAKKGTALAAGESLLYEGDVNRAGFLGLRVRTDGPARIVVAFDEILSGDGRLDFTRLGCANVVEWRIERAGEWTLESFEPYAAKYQRVAVLEGTAEVRGVFVRTYLSPLTARARFRASDPALGRIFDAAAESYRANAVDGFTDCPIRERAYWTGDTFFTARASRYLTGDAAPESLFLGNFFRPEPFDWSRYDSHGVDMSLAIPALYPGGITGSNFIPNYMLWTVLQTAEYVREFGDRDFALRAKERLLGILDFFRRFRNSDGLLEKLPGWVFIEWSKANELVQDVNYPSSMMYAAALAAAADLYAMPELAAEAAAVRREIVRQSWNGRWFCDNAVRQADGTLKLSGECTETCQYCAFFFGTVTPESHPELWQRILDEFGPDRVKAGRHPEIWPCNFIFGTCQRLELLSRAGRARQIVEETRNRFLPMAERTGTLWEHLDERASCCHGFCAVAAEYLMRDVLGVRAIDRLSQKVKLRLPADMPLDWVEATVPLTSASVAEIAWRKGPDGVPKYEIKLPEGWESVLFH